MIELQLLINAKNAAPGSFLGDFVWLVKWFPECVGIWNARGRRHGTAKTHAAGLEMCCPGGVYSMGSAMPRNRRIAGCAPSKCEVVHAQTEINADLRDGAFL